MPDHSELASFTPVLALYCIRIGCLLCDFYIRSREEGLEFLSSVLVTPSSEFASQLSMVCNSSCQSSLIIRDQQLYFLFSVINVIPMYKEVLALLPEESSRRINIITDTSKI